MMETHRDEQSSESILNSSAEEHKESVPEEKLAHDESEAEMNPKERLMHETVSLRAQVEAALFASPKPMQAADLIDVVSHSCSLKQMEALIHEIQEDFATRDGGFLLVYVKGLGYQFQTRADVSPLMEKIFASRPRPLSKAALETLAIIAYRQPTTRATIEFIRGVDSGSIIKNLLERELIRCVGRKEEAGRPMLFGTTDEFLQVFGLESLNDLPPLSAFQPTSETMQEALKELEDMEKEIDVDSFLTEDNAQTTDEQKDSAHHGAHESNENERIEGASQYDPLAKDENSEMDLPTRTTLTSPDGETHS